MEDGCENKAVLLQQLNQFLSSDSLIDEVGFVHPTQLTSLYESGSPSAMEGSNTPIFWCADHKLAISTEVLLPLFAAAKSAFVAARAEYQSVLSTFHRTSVPECGNARDTDISILADELLSYTRAVVILNSGYKTAWDVRKQIFKDLSVSVPTEELQLSSLALSLNPKCEEAWAYRRWAIQSMIESKCIGQIPAHLLQDELKFVTAIADRSRMNYRAWRHCCWLVRWMSISQVLHQLQAWKEWARQHVADNCCFHFRRCLFQRLLMEEELSVAKDTWLDEIEWNKSLINLYIGREALWVHRRFLFFVWQHHFRELDGCYGPQPCVSPKRNEWNKHFFESEISFANASTATCADDCSEDGEKQLIFASTFKLWVLLQWKDIPALYRKDAGEVMKLLEIKAPLQKRLWMGLFKSYLVDKVGGVSLD